MKVIIYWSTYQGRPRDQRGFSVASKASSRISRKSGWPKSIFQTLFAFLLWCALSISSIISKANFHGQSWKDSAYITYRHQSWSCSRTMIVWGTVDSFASNSFLSLEILIDNILVLLITFVNLAKAGWSLSRFVIKTLKLESYSVLSDHRSLPVRSWSCMLCHNNAGEEWLVYIVSG